MATENTTPQLRIIVHGNNDSRSSKFFKDEAKSQELKAYNSDNFAFYPFSDLIFNKPSSFKPNTILTSLIEQSEEGIAVSAILVLISQTEIFSEEMHSLIVKIPLNKLYGFNASNEKEWWEHVIVVFTFGKSEEKCENKVKGSIDRNEGIRDIIERAGGKYIWISDNTSIKELENKLLEKISLKQEIIIGETHSNGYLEMFDSFRKGLKSNRVTQNMFNYSLIILGENKSGKSTLGNLLLGQRDAPLFATEIYSKPSGMIKKFPVGNVEIEKFRIQIMDQPEFLKSKHYGDFLSGCMNEIKKSHHATFLFLLNITSKDLTKDEYLKINDIGKMLKMCDFDLFSNTIIVFTHVDELENSQSPEKILNDNLQSGIYTYTSKLIKSVKQPYIFINGVYNSKRNRLEVLKKIFPLERFCNTQRDQSHSFKDREGQISVKDQSSDYKGKNNIDDEIVGTLNEISIQIDKAIILLINLEESNQEICKEILINLSGELNKDFNRDKHRDFWDYTYIVFQVQFSNGHFIQKKIKEYQSMPILPNKLVNNCCIYATRDDPSKVSSELKHLIMKNSGTLEIGVKSQEKQIILIRKNMFFVNKKKFSYFSLEKNTCTKSEDNQDPGQQCNYQKTGENNQEN